MGRLRIHHLALLSGFCGIAYEVLFMRLLSTFLGEMFYVGAAVLATFLSAFGLGALYAWRLTRWLWAFEIAVGAYAIVLAGVLYASPVGTLEALAPIAGQGPAQLAATVVALLFVPAAMIGFSVPMFTLYAGADPAAPSRGFRAVYAAYNLGAAVCVLALEYLLLRALGIQATVAVLALLNLAIGVAVRGRPAPQVDAAPSFSLPKPMVIALALASIASGIWQLLLFKFAEQALGPFHENFALVVALALLGLFFGTLLAGRLGWSAARWMTAGALAAAASFAALNPIITSWAWVNQELGMLPWSGPLFKLALLAALGGLPLLAFGAAVPVLLAELPRDGAQAAGRLLAISSFANVAGYLAIVFLLYERVDLRGVVAIVCALLFAAAVLLLPRPRRSLAWGVPGAALALLVGIFPGRTLLDYGYENLRTLDDLRILESHSPRVETVKRFDNRVDIVRTRSGHELIYINGYHTVATMQDGRTNFGEVVFGLTPALYVRSPDDALVLGLGTGITAGATASVFRRTTAIEINPAVFSLLPRFAAHNFDIARNPRARLELKDAITALTERERRYDAIVNTVTSPLYFSSAKLYTREFFSLAASRLKPGGVYVLWFDSRVTEAGTRVIFQTLKAVFAECHLVYIRGGYLQVVCGNQALAPRPLGAPLDERVQAVLREEAPGFEPSELLLSLVFPRTAIHTADWGVPANRLDRPVLEFIMSGAALRRARGVSVLSLAGVDVRRSALAESPLEGEALARRCLALRTLERSPDCVAAMQKDLSPWHLRAYALGVLGLPAAGASRDDALDMLEYVVRAQSAGDADLVDRWAARLKPARVVAPGDLYAGYRAALLQARHRVLTRRDVPDALVRELVRVSPMDPSALEVLAHVAALRGEGEAAGERVRLLAWHGVDGAYLKRLSAQLESLRAGR